MTADPAKKLHSVVKRTGCRRTRSGAVIRWRFSASDLLERELLFSFLLWDAIRHLRTPASRKLASSCGSQSLRVADAGRDCDHPGRAVPEAEHRAARLAQYCRIFFDMSTLSRSRT